MLFVLAPLHLQKFAKPGKMLKADNKLGKLYISLYYVYVQHLSITGSSGKESINLVMYSLASV